MNIIELRNILHRQLEKSHCLKPDIAYYGRNGAAHPNKTYDFLYTCMVRWLDTQTLKRNRQAQENLQNNLKDKDKDPGRSTHSHATPAAPGQEVLQEASDITAIATRKKKA